MESGSKTRCERWDLGGWLIATEHDGGTGDGPRRSLGRCGLRRRSDDLFVLQRQNGWPTWSAARTPHRRPCARADGSVLPAGVAPSGTRTRLVVDRRRRRRPSKSDGTALNRWIASGHRSASVSSSTRVKAASSSPNWLPRPRLRVAAVALTGRRWISTASEGCQADHSVRAVDDDLEARSARGTLPEECDRPAGLGRRQTSSDRRVAARRAALPSQPGSGTSARGASVSPPRRRQGTSSRSRPGERPA